MKRRAFLECSVAAAWGAALLTALRQEHLDAAAKVLALATRSGEVAAAVMHVTQGDKSFTRSFGKATNEHAMFLLGSISKPISVTALMTLLDRGAFTPDDRLRKFIPQFTGEDREDVTIRHLLTHVSGLPDQLPENDALRSKHAPLSEFAEKAIGTPLPARAVPSHPRDVAAAHVAAAAR